MKIQKIGFIFLPPDTKRVIRKLSIDIMLILNPNYKLKKY